MTTQPGQALPIAALDPPHTVPAFATHIDHYLLPDHETLNPELLAAIAGWRREDPGLASSNRLGWHSSRGLFRRGEAPFQVLQHQIRSALANGVRRYWRDFDPARFGMACEGWVNVNGQGAFNTPHEHAAFHLSGCYYVSVPSESADDSSGALEFINPAGAGAAAFPNGAPLVEPKMRLRPRAGMMVIFPSHVLHWVYPNQDAADRVSIAFNMRVVAKEQRPAG